MEKTNCNLCGSGNEKLMYSFVLRSNKETNLVDCLDCGLKYLNPRLSKKEIKRYYDGDYHSYNQLTKEFNKSLSIFEKIRANTRNAIFKYCHEDKSKSSFITK